MHVLVTGATGTIGSVVTTELVNAGHTVLALTRSDTAERAVRAAGAEPLRGTLADLDGLRSGVARVDGVVHLAFGQDGSGTAAFAAAMAQESAALAALGEGLVGTGRPLVMASGTPWTPGRVSTEADPVAIDGPVGIRGRALRDALTLADRGVRAVAVRLARTVHDRGRGGFTGVLVDTARRTGISGYPGDGSQRWPAVHALDAAVLFRLALERAEPGTSWHAVAEEGVGVLDIATVIGRRLGVPVHSVPEDTYGPYGPIFAADGPSSSTHTRHALGWQPTHRGLLHDLEHLEHLEP